MKRFPRASNIRNYLNRCPNNHENHHASPNLTKLASRSIHYSQLWLQKQMSMTSSSDTQKAFDFHVLKVAPHQLVYKQPETLKSSPWKPSSRRTGVLALKCGMTTDYDQWGVRRALTVLKLENVVVTSCIREEERGYNALQIGAGTAKEKRLPKSLLGIFSSVGVEPKIKVSEFRITPDAFLPVGTLIDVRHFVPGQYVNIQGVTQGKGFQGAMKRWGFSGQGASHGNSRSHRVLGSVGQNQTPGRVVKGKKMPGHMGLNTITVECLQVYKIDIKRGLVYVIGCVPGKAGSYLRMYDAPKKPFNKDLLPPFPSYTLSASDKELAKSWQEDTFLPAEVEAAMADSKTLPDGYIREPPYEWIVAPPQVDPFSIPENEEGEAA
jgi:large subunit ribosomal protein L3